MNVQLFPPSARGFLFLVVIALAVAFSGCSTTPKVDWNARIGNYTYDQAVVELGPPDKQAKLTNGNLVAEWVTHRSSGGGLSIGTGFYGRHGGVGIGNTIGSGYPDRVLRLTFGKDGRLDSWTKN